MSRQRSESGYYHIMIRGNNKKSIFEKTEEKEKFLEIIKKNIAEDKWNLKAYCIMDNHAHLLIEECDNDISEIMKKANVSYAMFYNKKHNMIGHVFQDRYRSEAVTDDRYLLTVTRYIHQNPMKSGMVKNIEDYKWSSYNEYIKESNAEITDIHLLEVFSKNREEAVKKFIDFHEEMEKEIFLEDKEEMIEYEEKKAWKMIEEKKGTNKYPPSKKELIELLLKNTNLSQRKIARMLEANRGTVQRIANLC